MAGLSAFRGASIGDGLKCSLSDDCGGIADNGIIAHSSDFATKILLMHVDFSRVADSRLPGAGEMGH